MQNPSTRSMAAMIPLQVAVYESGTGGTSVSVMNTGMMGRMFTDPLVRDGIGAAREELLAIMATIGGKRLRE